VGDGVLDSAELAVSAHTPGPWMVRDGLTVDSAQHTVASITFDPLLMDEVEQESAANARLIAAAPDLYAALHALMHDDLHATEHLAAAHAALAKAEGK
jgi:hypothetical protein